MSRKRHWDRAYTRSSPDQLGWYQDTPELSLLLIDSTGLGPDAIILDVGGGASVLSGCLLDRGYKNVSVLDLSEAAIRHAQARLGNRASLVRWHVQDITSFEPPRKIDIWHDRAVLHFLTNRRDRQLYAHALEQSLSADGRAIIATFALDGPTRCSGLRVRRYGTEDITSLLGPRFQLLDRRHEVHVTPGDVEQRFTYFVLRRALFNRTGGRV